MRELLPSGGQSFISEFPVQISGFLVGSPSGSSSTTSSENASFRGSNRGCKLQTTSTFTERPKQTKFAFVHQTGPTVTDGGSRRLIKKHVMADIGKSRRKPAPISKQYHEVQVNLTGAQDSDEQNYSRDIRTNGNRHPPELEIISRFGATRDPFIVYPIEMTTRTRQLMDHVCGGVFPLITTVREAFMPFALTDAAAFHQMLAVLVLYMPFNRPNELNKSIDYEATESIFHHAKAIALVKRRMDNLVIATSEGTIAAIAMMLCQSHMLGDLKMSHSHLNGLKRILELRKSRASKLHGQNGRIKPHDLSHALTVAVGAISRTGSITEDTPPAFPFHTHLVSLDLVFPSTVTLPIGWSNIALQIDQYFPCLAVINKIFVDVARLSAFLQATCHAWDEVWTDVSIPITYLAPITHRVLSIRDPVVPGDAASTLREILRLSLVIYVGFIRRKFGLHCIIMRVQLRKLLMLISPKDCVKFAPQFDNLKLWIMTLGAMEASETDMKIQFDALLIEQYLVLGITGRKELETRLKSLPWVEGIHGIHLDTLPQSLDVCP